MSTIDSGVFQTINHWPEALAPMFRFFSEATKILPGKILLGAAILCLLSYPKTRWTTVIALVSVGLANELTDVLKALAPQARPCVELPNVILRTGLLTSAGTASAHSANMAAVAAVFLLRHGKWGGIWLSVAILTGLSRIYVGVHYPSQVLLGWGCGILIGVLAVKATESLAKRFQRSETLQAAEGTPSVGRGIASDHDHSDP